MPCRIRMESLVGSSRGIRLSYNELTREMPPFDILNIVLLRPKTDVLQSSFASSHGPGLVSIEQSYAAENDISSFFLVKDEMPYTAMTKCYLRGPTAQDSG